MPKKEEAQRYQKVYVHIYGYKLFIVHFFNNFFYCIPSKNHFPRRNFFLQLLLFLTSTGSKGVGLGKKKPSNFNAVFYALLILIIIDGPLKKCYFVSKRSPNFEISHRIYIFNPILIFSIVVEWIIGSV